MAHRKPTDGNGESRSARGLKKGVKDFFTRFTHSDSDRPASGGGRPSHLDKHTSVERIRKSYLLGGDKYSEKRRAEVNWDELETWKDQSKREKTCRSTTYTVSEELNSKVILWEGDITRLGVDAIVNAANNGLRGGGGVDGAIHRGAGRQLLEENIAIHRRCETGEVKVAAGYMLPSDFVIHTVGPVAHSGPSARNKMELENCYRNSLNALLTLKPTKDEQRSIAFPGISTGVYGYPIDDATEVALRITREWLETGDNKDKVTAVVFCVFLPESRRSFVNKLPIYFPSYQKRPSSADEDDQTAASSAKLPPLNKKKHSGSSDSFGSSIGQTPPDGWQLEAHQCDISPAASPKEKTAETVLPKNAAAIKEDVVSADSTSTTVQPQQDTPDQQEPEEPMAVESQYSVMDTESQSFADLTGDSGGD